MSQNNDIESDLELGIELIRERLESMDKHEWEPAINEIRILFRNFIRQLDLPVDESVNYHQVQDQMPSSFINFNEVRSIYTQTDPISTSDEEDDGFLMENEEDLYEELDLPDLKPETMDRLLTLDQAVDYEEVELKRSSSCQRLGLTLCYSNELETTDIFVSQIEAGSVAKRSGRVYIGDQILQINGMNVLNRQQTMDHFARESERIVLLLARPSAEHEEEDDDLEDEQVILDLSGLNFINEKQSTLGTLVEHDDSTTENSQAHEKDSGLSGLSRTTDSEPEQQQKQHTSTQSSDQKPQPSNSMERDFEHELANLHSEMEKIRLECAKLMNQRNNQSIKQEKPANTQAQQALSLMGMIEKLSTSYHQAPSHISDSTKTTIIERRSFGTETPPPSTHKQRSNQSTFASNFLQTPKMSRKHANNSSQNSQFNGHQMQMQAPRTPRSLHRQQPIVYDETTSSAYNTGGDSCRSTPNNMQNQQFQSFQPPPRRPIHLTVAQKNIDVSTLVENPYHTIETPVASLNTPMASHFRLPRFAIQPPVQQIQQDAKKYPQRIIPPPQQSNQSQSFQPGETMYTTADKLAETIELQQRLLREAMTGPTSYSKQSGYSYQSQPQNQNEYHTIRTNDTKNGSTYE